MVCLLRELLVDVWGHVLSMLSLKHMVHLDSAAAKGSTRMVLHENIFPRSVGPALPVGDRGQTAYIWCLTHGVPVKELFLFCIEQEDRLLEVCAQHKRLIWHIMLLCEGRQNLLRTLNQLKIHALDDLVNQSLRCRSHFDLPVDKGLTAEEKVMCRRLTTLWFHGGQGTNKWLIECLEQSAVLETVRLWDVTNLAPEVIQSPALRNAKFNTLYLQRCKVTNTLARCIAETCKQLREISIYENAATAVHSGHSGADNDDLLTDCGLIAIASGCPLLETVSLDHQSANPALLEAFAMHCPQLCSLCAGQCVLNAAALNALATRCLSLTTLSVTWAAASEECVAQGLTKLEALTLNVDSSQPTQLAKALQVIASHCRSLRKVVVDGGGIVPAHQYRDIGAALVALARANPNVGEFILWGLRCGALGDEHLVTVAQCWPKLFSLNISSGLPDAALSAFAQHCPELAVLLIAGADPLITDHSIRMLAQHGAKLSYVSLTQAHQVTEEAFTALVRGCPQLRHVAVPVTISQDALKRIASVRTACCVYR